MIAKWQPGSLAIDASAGYGKTEILCTRLLALFLSDADAARRTVALTFTRAAAGEIYARMLLLLGEALRGETQLNELRGKFRTLVGTDAFDRVAPEELEELLVRLIRDMGELNISTIDSFFYRLVRAYSIELGLPGTVELAAEGDGNAENDRLARELFGRSGATEELLAACRESRYGNESKRCFDSCRELLRLTLRFRAHRDDPAFWGGGFGRFVPADPAALKRALAICDAHSWPENYHKKLRPLLAACAEAGSAEYRFTRPDTETLRAFLAHWQDFPAELPPGYKRGWSYPPETAAAMRTLLANGRNVLLCQCARRTAALRTMLDEFLRLYDSRMLRRGRLNFADLPQLLSENSAAPGAQEEFLNEIRYRTNCRFAHFLIDEFQDTSRAQWEVLDPVCDDNGEGDHSLFLVGDVKQAIYGWREGDSKLMGEVVKRRWLRTEALGCSFRYGSGICEALNRIFGDAVARCAGSLGNAGGQVPPQIFAAIGERWGKVFRDHVPAPHLSEPGEFEILALSPDPETKFADSAAELIVLRLRELDFFGRGLSGGVLVRNKKDGIRLRDALLEAAPELAGSIVWEGDESIVGDPLVSSLLAFGVWLQHPADTCSGGVVGMNQLMRELIPNTDDERQEWLTLIAERGIAGFLRRVLSRLNTRSISWDETPAAGWAPADNGDVQTLVALAAAFDAEGAPRDLLAFRERAAAARKTPAAVAGKLRLLTIHHSKGLTFDIVFHPVFDPARGGNWKHPDTLGMVTDSARKWLLCRPREEGMTVPEIADAVLEHHADTCFEELCALYVALTRARYGMYVYLPPRSREKCGAYHPDWKENGSFKGRLPLAKAAGSYGISDFLFEACFADPELFPADRALPVETRGETRFIRRAFGCTYREGTVPAPRRPEPLRADFDRGVPKMFRDTPSHLGQDIRLRFTLPGADSGELLGTRVHAFFSGIGRWSDFTPPPGTDEKIMAHYRACAAEPEIVRMLDDECELWLERPFDVVLRDLGGNAALVSGCFDRVQIRRDASGRIAGALIVDYKSNRTDADGVPRLVDHYRGQLETYRKALAALLGIDPGLIGCRLIFTRIGAVAEV